MVDHFHYFHYGVRYCDPAVALCGGFIKAGFDSIEDTVSFSGDLRTVSRFLNSMWPVAGRDLLRWARLGVLVSDFLGLPVTARGALEFNIFTCVFQKYLGLCPVGHIGLPHFKFSLGDFLECSHLSGSCGISSAAA